MARSASIAKTSIPKLVHTFPTTGHIISTFKHTLIVISPICDAECTITLSKRDITVFVPDSTPIFIGWHETTRAKLLLFSLLLDTAQFPLTQPNTENALLSAYSAYDLPSVKALVRYLHAASVSPINSAWVKAINEVKFSTWTSITYSNAAKYYPKSSDTIKAHILQSIKLCAPPSPPPVISPTMLMVAEEPPEVALPCIQSKGVNIWY